MKQPALGDNVVATVSNCDGGEDEIRGVVIEVLSAQFVVQAPAEDGSITRYAKGYRFVMNKDKWRIDDE